MAGLNPTAIDIQYACGHVALNLKKFYQDAVSLNDYLVATPDATLIALGISQADVTLLKSAYADLAFQKTSAFDSSTFVKQLVGLGLGT